MARRTKPRKTRSRPKGAEPQPRPAEGPAAEPGAEEVRSVGPATREGLLIVPLAEIAEIADEGADHRLKAAGTDKAAAEEEWRRFVASIRSAGILEPVGLARAGPEPGDGYEVVYGRRRVRGAREAGLSEVPAVVYAAAAEVVRKRLAALENLHRRDLHPLEEAVAVCHLLESLTGRRRHGPEMDAAGTVEVPTAALQEAASLLGKSEGWVRDRAILMRLAPRVRDLVASGRLTLGQAREVAKLTTDTDQWDVARWVARREDGSGGQTVEQTAAQVARHLCSLRGTRWDLSAPFAGRPACDTCPHASANATSLFAGTDAEALAEAKCLHPACYRHKTAAAEKAFAASVQRARAEKVEPTASAVRPLVAEGIKVGAVVRALKPKKARARKTSETEGGYVPWEKTPHGRCRTAQDKWYGAAAKALTPRLKSPLAWLVLFARADLPALRNLYRRDEARVPKKARPVLDAVADGKVTVKAAGDLVGAVKAPDREQALRGLPPKALSRMTDRLGLKLPHYPTLKEFQEQPEPKKPAKKAKTKKRTKKARAGGKETP